MKHSQSKLRMPQWLGLVMAAALIALPGALPAQSLWNDDLSRPMLADKKGVAVGDIITIVVQETTTASKDNKTATARQSGVNASIDTFLYSPAASGLLTKAGQMPALKLSSKSDFSGGGSVANTERIVAKAAVTVIDVLPNKNLVVEGRRETSFAGERQTSILRGVVRPEDVLANNTVFSYNVAEATIQIINQGQVSETQRKGWFHRFWDKLTPF